MSLFEILALRSEYEELTLNYKIPGSRKAGTIPNLKWFLKNGQQKNHRREGFARATELATLILDHEAQRKANKRKR